GARSTAKYAIQSAGTEWRVRNCCERIPRLFLTGRVSPALIQLLQWPADPCLGSTFQETRREERSPRRQEARSQDTHECARRIRRGRTRFPGSQAVDPNRSSVHARPPAG